MTAATIGYPLGMTEIEFVDVYRRVTLRKPQVGADAALLTMVTAAADDRLALLGVMGDYVAEAALRLVAVYQALSDRTYAVGQSLLAPLPGKEEWDRFAMVAVAAEPRSTLRDLYLGDDAIEPAERLRSMGDIGWIGPLISATTGGGVVIEGTQSKGLGVARFAIPGIHVPVLDVVEDDAATLADTAAELSGIARGFLGAYVEARTYAGRVN